MKKLILNILFVLCSLFAFAQQQFDVQGHSTTGSDTYTVSITNLTSYQVGSSPVRGVGFSIIFDTSSSGACTLNVNGLGAKTINGDITAGVVYRLEYNVVTDEFDMISGGGGGGTGDVVGPASSTDGVPALFDGTTGKLLKNSTPTGTGNPVLANSPTLVTPALGTPSSLVGTNITGTASGLTAGTVTTNANLTGHVTSTGNAAVLGSFSSANLSTALSDETGSGAAVFANSPTFTTPDIGTATGTASGDQHLTGTNTYTGAVTDVITTTNSLTLSSSSLSTSVTPSFILVNPTSAAAGAQQYSPTRRTGGQGWKTQATAASQPVWFDETVVPVQGVANPTAIYQLRSSVNSSATNMQFDLNSDGGRLELLASGIRLRTSGGGVGGLSFNGSAPTGGQITMTPGSFRIDTGSNWGSAGSGIVLDAGATINATSGVQNAVSFEGSFIPSSGTAEFNAWNFSDIINQTGGANGQTRGLNLAPVFTAAAAFDAYVYTPTTPSNISGRSRFLYGTSGQVVIDSDISPAQITSNTDDYAPTGHLRALTLRLSTDASRNLTSVAGGEDGRILIIMNIGAQNLVIKDDDGATGTAANRFQLNADVTILPEQVRMFIYDGTSSRWRIMGN